MLRVFYKDSVSVRSVFKSKMYPVMVKCFASNTGQQMVDILKSKFPLAKNVEVVDVSGGCGAMYEVLVESEEFKGLSIVKQHRMINEILKEQIKEMHGLRIHTIIPKESKKT